MRMTEAEILEQLSKIFPNKIIFAEQYSKGRHLLTFGIYKQAKAEGLSSIQWLTSKGYLWKETGYVEPDMHIRDAVLPSSDANAFNRRSCVSQISAGWRIRFDRQGRPPALPVRK